jgi:hypothetical protein
LTPKLPDLPPTEESSDASKKEDPKQSSQSKPDEQEDFEALRKRFDALKKK